MTGKVKVRQTRRVLAMKDSMRIVNYNILDGGVGRVDPVAEVLEAQRANVVVLVEADDEAVVDRIARRLGFEIIIGRGRDHAIAVLTGCPVLATVNHAKVQRDGPRCLLEATLQTPDNEELTVYAVHFSAGAAEADERRREAELLVLLEVTSPLRAAKRPHLLVGDFNANSPVQQIDFGRCKESTQQAAAAQGGNVPRRVVTRLMENGYVDTLLAASPEAARTAATFTTHRPGQRVDYIFSHGLSLDQIGSAWIETDRLAEFASDHFPVGTELRI